MKLGKEIGEATDRILDISRIFWLLLKWAPGAEGPEEPKQAVLMWVLLML